ncbi:T9SS C-terminal target domain-containing protein [candidate division KSB1 bacterium]|nr:T9SS type A sorting domain-containing protein [candidate division KSB1 bacterium]RQW06723.1 MAG: T9SS C-terminal target domain-containing protein [candidate division KSB1 bacterium]
MKNTTTHKILTPVLIIVWASAMALGGTVLVDFGASFSESTFGLPGWNTLLKSSNLEYTSAGNGGLIAIADAGEYGDYRGVRGTPRQFSSGERIVVTWYNTSDEIITFTSRISFSDENEPNEISPDGTWYTMRQCDDYRYTYSNIQPHATAQTAFNITDSGVHKTDETYSLVNINLAIEWGSTYEKQFLVCDKIELLFDADTLSPAEPTDLTADIISSSKVQLHWNAPADNVGVVEYLVYKDGEIEGYSRSSDYTCVFLEPEREYSVAVSALDAAGNESEPSTALSVATAAFSESPAVIHPDGLEYLGAIAMPVEYNWGGEALAYNPEGDGGQANTEDEFPGSLFVTNVNQPENGLVGQVSIPQPTISSEKNINDLNQAVTLMSPVNIRPMNINNWDYVDIWRTGLEVLPSEQRLYSSWSIHYTVSGEKHASISCCDLADLAGSEKYGAWTIGSPNEPPLDAMIGDWLFSVPQEWAQQHCAGRQLVVGRCRDGGLSGLGPTLYAFSPVGASSPAPDGVLDFTTLLQYGSVEGTDNYFFPHSIDGYKHSDDWREALWLATGNQNAVALVGNKALGDHWYGYYGERMRHDWVIADVPYPEFWQTDPDGKGWRSHFRVPMILFYNPENLAHVAAGRLQSYEPQPYAALRLEHIFWGLDHEIFSAVFDSHNALLYVTEFIRELEGQLVVHIWRINPVSTVARTFERNPNTFEIFQNYPNPFNSCTIIEYELHHQEHVKLEIYDVHGKKVKTLVDESKQAGQHRVTWNGTNQKNVPVCSGVYLYRLVAGSSTGIRTMLILK